MQTILETCDSKYILLQDIGYGGTSSVFKGYSINDDSHKILAIKMFKEYHRKYFEKEISINNILPPKHFSVLGLFLPHMPRGFRFSAK